MIQLTLEVTERVAVAPVAEPLLASVSADGSELVIIGPVHAIRVWLTALCDGDAGAARYLFDTLGELVLGA